jgi:hypothetical protein
MDVSASNKSNGTESELRQRREALLKMQQLSSEQLFALAVRAGIYTAQGDLAEPYRDENDPSSSRPTD